jgi:hypothetical protein
MARSMVASARFLEKKVREHNLTRWQIAGLIKATLRDEA